MPRVVTAIESLSRTSLIVQSRIIRVEITVLHKCKAGDSGELVISETRDNDSTATTGSELIHCISVARCLS